MDYNKNTSKILPEDGLSGIEIYRAVRFFFVYTHEMEFCMPRIAPIPHDILNFFVEYNG